jgi:hypothetical protein
MGRRIITTIVILPTSLHGRLFSLPRASSSGQAFHNPSLVFVIGRDAENQKRTNGQGCRLLAANGRKDSRAVIGIIHNIRI